MMKKVIRYGLISDIVYTFDIFIYTRVIIFQLERFTTDYSEERMLYSINEIVGGSQFVNTILAIVIFKFCRIHI